MDRFLEPLTQKERYKEKTKGGSTKAQEPRTIVISKLLEKRWKPSTTLGSPASKRNDPRSPIGPPPISKTMMKLEREGIEMSSFVPMSLLLPSDAKAKKRFAEFENCDESTPDANDFMINKKDFKKGKTLSMSKVLHFKEELLLIHYW
ncbi:hypothetical protein BLNAU_8803 [Blattamonas nauphoetae]|uniref:Uncharacterized protein n=1 Tax=Blattamonas nauphoetae TaxID=2049346 RepID=A0ABQ9XXQ7_9EUKA|nr:hypothetical protein BLNAU_8803 [Blattamonas nauphoetae]